MIQVTASIGQNETKEKTKDAKDCQEGGASSSSSGRITTRQYAAAPLEAVEQLSRAELSPFPSFLRPLLAIISLFPAFPCSCPVDCAPACLPACCSLCCSHSLPFLSLFLKRLLPPSHSPPSLSRCLGSAASEVK